MKSHDRKIEFSKESKIERLELNQEENERIKFERKRWKKVQQENLDEILPRPINNTKEAFLEKKKTPPYDKSR